MNETPSAQRTHIGFFGCRNAGKSSLVNAVTGQALAIVSDVKGTTTDPVLKAMELLPLGPVVVIDTPGFDDEGSLGQLRVRRTVDALNRCDVAVLVADAARGVQPEDARLLEMIRARDLPHIVAWNKADLPEATPIPQALAARDAVLAVSVLLAGLSSGITVAVISPVLAYFLGIAPQILTVPAIMVGNCVYVLLLYFIAGTDSKKVYRQIIAWITAAAAKFASLYAIVVWLICGALSKSLLAAGVMKPPMLKMLPATFSWPQLFTALIGGAVALFMVPLLRKALRK